MGPGRRCSLLTPTAVMARVLHPDCYEAAQSVFLDYLFAMAMSECQGIRDPIMASVFQMHLLMKKVMIRGPPEAMRRASCCPGICGARG